MVIIPWVKVKNIETYFTCPMKDNIATTSNPVALFVHGVGGSSKHWEPLLSELGEQIIPITIDLPGHGKSKGTVLNSISGVVDFLDEFLEVLEIKQPLIYVGHSVGGLIGLQFTLSHPEKVSKLCVICSAAKIQLHPDFFNQVMNNNWDMELLRKSFAEEIPEYVKNIVLDEFYFTRLDDNSTDFMNLKTVDLREKIKSIDIPSLIITGDDDVIISPRHSNFLSNQIKNSNIIRINKGGHYVQVEQPEIVANNIKTFCFKEGVSSLS
ncbi:alpha/beta hydrolase [Bacillus bombysepticus]